MSIFVPPATPFVAYTQRYWSSYDMDEACERKVSMTCDHLVDRPHIYSKVNTMGAVRSPTATIFVYTHRRIYGTLFCGYRLDRLGQKSWLMMTEGYKTRNSTLQQAELIITRNSCTWRSPVRSIGHARSCRRRVAAYWKEQTWRSQKCKYLPLLW